MAFSFGKKKEEQNKLSEEEKKENIVSDDIYKDFIPKDKKVDEKKEESKEKVENNITNQGTYHEKEYKSGFLEAHTKKTVASATSHLILILFYILVVVLGIVAFVMIRTDKYQFYFKNEQVIVNKGSIYQVELIPKNVGSFDYLNYTYTIADESIAKVDEFGTVTVVGSGTTDLKVSMKHGVVSKKMKIISENIEINSIDLKVYKKDKMLADTVVDMVPNETVTLHACANGQDNLNMNVNYSSSNTSVAIVDEFGNVTAKKNGSAVITGSRDGLSGSMTIRVSGSSSNSSSSSSSSKPTNKPSSHNTPVNTVKQEIQSISFASNKISIKLGGSAQLTLDVIPSSLAKSTFTWSSNNGNVTVDKNGRITAKSVGKSTITATSSNGKRATCEVEVTNESISIKSIKLSKSELSLKIGHSYQLVATIDPKNTTEREIVWSSSNQNVAIVSNGLVTGISNGDAIISVRNKDGSISVSCKVSVSSESTSNKLTGVDIGIVETTKYVGDKLQLTAKLTPSDAKASQTSWSSSDTSIATVSSSGLVTMHKAGTVTITVSVDGIKSSGRIIVKNKNTQSQTTTQTQKPASPMGDSYYKISTNQITVNKGGTATFTITISNAAGSVQVKSSNSGIASLDKDVLFFDGLDTSGKIIEDKQTITVTGKSSGTTTITVVPNDLAKYDPVEEITKSYTIDVTVN